jgi:TolB-like protein
VAKRLSLFLRYVVEQTLKGQSGRIKQYTIAVEALGYGADFDPQTDSIIRIQGRRLRRALDQYYFGQGKEDPVRIEIPKGGYVPIFLDNYRPTGASGAPEQPAPVSVKPPEFTDPTIAVVLFENLNEKDENSFFARGLTAEILVSLTRFSGLSVLGPLAQAEGKPIDYYKISHEYGSRFVLQGWIRCYGSKIRITTDLTDASTGGNLWGRTFEYDLEKTSLFEIEDTVAGQVAGIIADGVGIIFKKLQSETYPEHIKLSDVTLAVLKYNNAWMTLAPWDWESAIVALNDALATQPENALLLAMLANSYYADVLFEMNLVPDSSSKMEGLAHEAVSLDPDLQLACYNLVVINAFFGRPQKCIAEAKKVVAMNPNHPRVVAGSAVAVTTVGEYELGWELIEKAKRLNPHYPSWYHFVNYLVCFRNAQYEEAWAEAQKIHIKGTFWHPLFRTSILGKLGRDKEAKVYIEELLQIKPEFPKRPKEYIKLLFVLDEHVEMIWDGLYKAGMGELA